ncbi:hypothetical protein A4X09_0g412 [Tilletia walkeri]|uniref:Uncharacterized protein n=1 Tax=Tilletia walkeri TaxID=117179 RepID=A0A8X7NDY7_9BASI|nr:hypothetical protein A4X09_0g412 [Tilletia walkeri]
MARMLKTMPGRPRRMWTQAEDAKLKAMVKAAGDKVPRWSEIAKSLDGRNRKDVRKRWSYCLNPTLTKGAWSRQEDTLLRAAIHELGTDDWVHVASRVGSRTGDQCAKRWRDVLDPTIAHERWTPAADAKLLDLTKTLGHNWSLIATHFPGRRGVQCRNRSHSLSKRLEAGTHALDGTKTATRSTSVHPPVPSSLSPPSHSQGMPRVLTGPSMATYPCSNGMAQVHPSSIPMGGGHEALSPMWLTAPELDRNFNLTNSMTSTHEAPNSDSSLQHTESLPMSCERFQDQPILPGMFALLSSLNPAHPGSVMSQQFSPPPPPPPPLPPALTWAPPQNNNAFFITPTQANPPLENSQPSDMFNSMRPSPAPSGSEIKFGHFIPPTFDSGMNVSGTVPPLMRLGNAYPITSWATTGYHPSPTESHSDPSTAQSQCSSFQEGSMGDSPMTTTTSFFFQPPSGPVVGPAQPMHQPNPHHRYPQPSTPSDTSFHSSGLPQSAASTGISPKMAMFDDLGTLPSSTGLEAVVQTRNQQQQQHYPQQIAMSPGGSSMARFLPSGV